MRAILSLILLATGWFVFDIGPAQGGVLVFVSAATDQQIITYKLDEQSGALKVLTQTKLDGEPGALAISPNRKLLLAAMRSTGQLKSLRIEGTTGKLELLSTVEAGDDPAQISVDSTGRYLLTAYYVAAKVSVHEIADDGKLSTKSRLEIPTAEKAHAIVPSPHQDFVFVPHTGPNAIFQFLWDSKAGKLTANKPERLETGDKTGPRHMVWHPRHDVAYVDNEQGSSVTAYKLDKTSGVLRPAHTASTLPRVFSGNNSCAEIKIHPTGKFLYVSNRGHDSLAMFAVSDDGLALTSLGQQQTERTPRSFDINPRGTHLIAAGEGSGKLAVYAIDAKIGSLSTKHTYDVAPRLWWVLAAEVDR
jgi:6-phosphogluconolactonase